MPVLTIWLLFFLVSPCFTQKSPHVFYHGHDPMWILKNQPTCLITVFSQDPAIRSSVETPPVWVKQDGVLLHGPEVVGSNNQLSLTPEVVVATNNRVPWRRHYLWPQSLQITLQRRALWPNTTCCCPHSTRNTHTLLLPLPNALGTS